MNLEQFLARHKITLDDVLEKVTSSVDLVADDTLFVSGSLVEGIGNDQSDLDLHLITARQNIEFTACMTDVVVVVGDCVVDIRVVQRSEIDALLARFSNWAVAPRRPRRSFEFVDDERKLLYRLKLGRALYGAEHLAALQHSIREIGRASCRERV